MNGPFREDLAATAPPRTRGPHVLIIGGGASGVLMAAHLLAHPEHEFRVTIVEGRNQVGCGVAYSTQDPDHLLNTRAQNMSAFATQPNHFLDWLRTRRGGADVTGQSFVSRALYGDYLAELLDPYSARDRDRRLRCVRRLCVRLRETAHGVTVLLEDGHSLVGDMAVLATGHVQPMGEPGDAMIGPWETPTPLDPEARVVIVGSGLTMVDSVLSLLGTGHRGEIIALSRRGQLPRSHGPGTPLSLTPEDLPLGAPISRLMAWTRRLARQATSAGGSWRDAIDGLRPHVRNLWRGLSGAEKARFLRHAATWWDVHRHRIPPASAEAIDAALQSGQLALARGAFRGAVRIGTSRRVTYRPSGASADLSLLADRVIDCRGLRRDPEIHASPLVADLLASGQARVDALRISLDVTETCQLIGHNGRVSPRLFAIGPVTRAAFWEITAIPDIREQVAQLSARLADR